MRNSTNDRAFIISVEHECEDGWHKFQSAEVPGLYLRATQDELEEAFEEIPELISILYEADFGQKVSVRQAATFREYLETLPEHYKPRIHHYTLEKTAA